MTDGAVVTAAATATGATGAVQVASPASVTLASGVLSSTGGPTGSAWRVIVSAPVVTLSGGSLVTTAVASPVLASAAADDVTIAAGLLSVDGTAAAAGTTGLSARAGAGSTGAGG